MGSTKPFIVRSDRSAETAFAAALSAVQDGEYEVWGVCNEQRELLFQSPKTAVSWGSVFMVDTVSEGSGSALRISAGNVPGAPRALLDGRKNQKAGEKFCAAVQGVLESGVEPAPAPVDSFARGRDGTTVAWTSGDFPLD